MSKKLITLTGSLLLILLLLAVPVVVAAPPRDEPRPPAKPGPRPPSNALPDEEAAGAESDEDDLNGVQGAIYGTVTNLSTGGPGAGLVVRINAVAVTTDWDGCFSLTGQPAGAYVLELELPAEWQPGEKPPTVYLDGRNTVTVDLAYYSQPPAAPDLAPPTGLPESGAARDGRLFLVAGIGLLLTAGLLRASSGTSGKFF